MDEAFKNKKGTQVSAPHKPMEKRAAFSHFLTVLNYFTSCPPILWLPDAKNQLIGKDPDGGKD